MTPVTVTFSKAVSLSSVLSVLKDVDLGVAALFDCFTGRMQFTVELPSQQQAFMVAQRVLTNSATEHVPVAVNLGHPFTRSANLYENKERPDQCN